MDFGWIAGNVRVGQATSIFCTNLFPKVADSNVMPFYLGPHLEKQVELDMVTCFTFVYKWKL